MTVVELVVVEVVGMAEEQWLSVVKLVEVVPKEVEASGVGADLAALGLVLVGLTMPPWVQVALMVAAYMLVALANVALKKVLALAYVASIAQA